MLEHQTGDQAPITEFYGRLVSLSLPCPAVSLAHFLQQGRGRERFYWETSRDHIAFAGIGTAVELIAYGPDRFEKIRDRAGELFDGAVMLSDTHPFTRPRLFGGFAFRDDFVPDNTWAAYAPAHFVLPHYQLVSISGEKWLTINVQIPLDEDPQDLLPELQSALSARTAELQIYESTPLDLHQSQPCAVNYPMPYPVWHEKITHATECIKAGDLKKVVLSRVCEVQFDDRINLIAVLRFLADHYAECYRFLFEPRPSHAFYGATPELLAQVSGHDLLTMGLAGSIQRGRTPESDRDLTNQLLNSAKDRHEQQIVVDQIMERLRPVTSQLTASEVGIYALSNIQHLHTAIQGTLKSAAGVLPVVELLHPTPALGGSPREAALDMIRQSESVPRGWYAAPVGWIDHQMNGQFAVAIRSAVAQNSRAWLYAGAGIVADSLPESEWNETALKFRPMLSALGINDEEQI
jgi:menaquinone-specific isochorismate synthase